MNTRADDGHGNRLITFMRSNDLFAVDSMFRPPRRFMFGQEKKKRLCNATYLQKDNKLRPKKLDYFLVSNRWKSCVVDSKKNWVPSIHRFGRAFDHSLIRITWKWRVKSDKALVAKDFKSMQREDWIHFDKKLKEKMQVTQEPSVRQNSNKYIDSRLRRMNNCLRSTIKECVHDKKRLNDIKREISDRTRLLYEARAAKFSKISAQGDTVSAQLRKRWNRRIKDSNLKDYHAWLRKMATKMEEADRVGDSETVFRVVKIVSGLMTTASGKAPSVDEDGKLILDQKRLAQVWRQFLAAKFPTTEAETKRDPYEELGPQLIADPLTEEAFERAVKKLKIGKACGPDGIPGEVFKNSETAAKELYKLLKLMWEREYIPPELVRATFILLYKNKGSVNDPKMYRCIGLLPHSYKILSLVMLERIASECSNYLSD